MGDPPEQGGTVTAEALPEQQSVGLEGDAVRHEHPCTRGDSPILVIYQEGRGPRGQIDRPLYDEVVRQVEAIVPPGLKHPHLDVWLESPGGDAHAAYKIAIFLRTMFEEVHFVIPDYAKSAATLLSLAADKIFMAPGAELGPLDVQEIREGDVQMHSTLDTANAMQTLFTEAMQLVSHNAPPLVAATGLARDRMIEHLMQFAAAFTRPLVEQLDPEEILASGTSLLVTYEYGARLLAQVREQELSEAYPVAQQLVQGYPTHGYVIDRSEATRRLGLPVEYFEAYPHRLVCLNLFRAMQGRGSLLRLTCAADIAQQLQMEPDNGDDDDDSISPEPAGDGEGGTASGGATEDVGAPEHATDQRPTRGRRAPRPVDQDAAEPQALI